MSNKYEDSLEFKFDELAAEEVFIKFIFDHNKDLLTMQNRVLYDELLKRFKPVYRCGKNLRCTDEVIMDKFIKGIFHGWQIFIDGVDYNVRINIKDSLSQMKYDILRLAILDYGPVKRSYTVSELRDLCSKLESKTIDDLAKIKIALTQ